MRRRTERGKFFLGICQRDGNYYEHLNDPETQRKIRTGVSTLWENKIKGRFPGGRNYVVDLLLTRSLESAHIIDFNPYAPRTDALLFTYAELYALHLDLTETAAAAPGVRPMPELRVIDPASHPRSAPAN